MTRNRVDFWLDTDNPAHVDLLDIIAQMKIDRIFARSVRDGLRLIAELNTGKSDLLETLYPDVIKRLQADYLARVAETGGLNVGGAGVAGDVRTLTLDDEVEEVEETTDEALDRLLSDSFFD